MVRARQGTACTPVGRSNMPERGERRELSDITRRTTRSAEGRALPSALLFAPSSPVTGDDIWGLAYGL